MYPYAYADALKDLLCECKSAYVFPDENERVLILFDADSALQQRLVEEAATVGSKLGLNTLVGDTDVDSFSGISPAYEVLVEQMQQSISCSAAVKAARDYVLSHYSNPNLGLTDVAEAAGINPSYLSRLMKLELGTSFSKFLTTTRIQAALELMRSGEYKMREISELVGYSTPHYFSTTFKKILGLSPAEYRSEERHR